MPDKTLPARQPRWLKIIANQEEIFKSAFIRSNRRLPMAVKITPRLFFIWKKYNLKRCLDSSVSYGYVHQLWLDALDNRELMLWEVGPGWKKCLSGSLIIYWTLLPLLLYTGQHFIPILNPYIKEINFESPSHSKYGYRRRYRKTMSSESAHCLGRIFQAFFTSYQKNNPQNIYQVWCQRSCRGYRQCHEYSCSPRGETLCKGSFTPMHRPLWTPFMDRSYICQPDGWLA